jgi:predicted metal-dependent hydrolase
VSERPRDRLGRPLAWDAVGYPGVDQRASITSAEAVIEARDYLERDLPFHAHEVLEMRWRCCPADERSLWRGLAQAAAGATHAARGNAVGAARLIARGQQSIDEYAGPLDDATRELIDALTARAGDVS